jgi:hypothetical protein
MQTDPKPGAVAALLLELTLEQTSHLGVMTERDKCYVVYPAQRNVPGVPESYWGICLVHEKVADVGHHVYRGGSSD